MELYFLRHGLAGQYGDPKYKDDSLRPLTAEGRRKIRSSALGMKILGLRFDAVISSPYVRARQTAEITAQVFKIKTKAIYLTENLLPPASCAALLKDVQTHFPASESILFTGHEPHLTEMISSLLKSPVPLDIDFKKGGLCALSLHQPWNAGSATLNWLLTSKQLGLIGQKGSYPSDPEL